LIPLYTSRLTPAEYGSYGLALTLYSFAPPFVSLALGTAIARFYFDYHDVRERNRAMGALGIAIIMLAAAFAILSELALDLSHIDHFANFSRPQLRLILWSCACIPVAEVPSLLFRAGERAGAYAAINLGSVAVTASTTAYLMLARDAGLTGMLTGMFAGQFVVAIYGILFITVGLRPRWSRGLLRSAIVYSVPFIPHLIGNALMVGADRWALEWFGFQDGLGLYTLATQLTSPISMATQAWNEATSPRFLAAWREGGDQAARATLPKITAGFVVCGGGVLLAIVIGLPIARYFIGARFQAAFPLVPWVGLSLVVGSLFSAFINVLFLRKTTRIIPVLTFASVIVNAALNLVLVPRLGVPGAILATGIAYTFRSGIMLSFALRALRPAAA
jgi:O-antigen/teichoic acid export membrane protein